MDSVVFFVLFAVFGRLMHKKGDLVTWEGLLKACLAASAVYVLIWFIYAYTLIHG